MRNFVLACIVVVIACTAVLPSRAVTSGSDWSQWGQDPQHMGMTNVLGQQLNHILFSMVYDPFASAENADNYGLTVHYQVPLSAGNRVFIEFKSGTWISCDPVGSGKPSPCGPDSWDSQVWNEKMLEWDSGSLIEKWTFASGWKPVPNQAPNGLDRGVIGMVGWEPVFQPVLAGGFLYVPDFGGTILKLDQHIGTVISRINPLDSNSGNLDPHAFVVGPLSADGSGNVYYNIIRFSDLSNPWGTDVSGSWLVKISPDDTATAASYTSLVPGVPNSSDLCFETFKVSQLPWPPSPKAQPTRTPCGSQRPGVNIAPAIGADGTIYTLSRAHFNSEYSYLIAVNPDLSPKWDASLRDRLNDGCDVSLPANGPPRGCSLGASRGVDPATNLMPAGRVMDQSSSSPVVAPDGSVLYGAYSRYNYDRGHLFKFSSTGQFLGAYDYGWDITPAIYTHEGTYSILLKDNHYYVGSYCNNLKFCAPSPPGPFDITQLSPNLTAEWAFQDSSTESCTRNLDGSISCIPDPYHPNGFEWCINAPAIDASGVVYAESEDGYAYAIAQGGTVAQRIFLGISQNAAYTPLSIGPNGKVYAENAGQLFVLGA